MSTNPLSSKPISRIRPVTIRPVNWRERRQRRADDVLEALHLQMDACREDAQLTAMVVADEFGMCLASSGQVGTCTEIAARLPILGRKAGDFEGVLLGGPKAGVPVAMKRITIDGTELFACAVGGDSGRHASQLARAETGVRRILAA